MGNYFFLVSDVLVSEVFPPVLLSETLFFELAAGFFSSAEVLVVSSAAAEVSSVSSGAVVTSASSETAVSASFSASSALISSNAVTSAWIFESSVLYAEDLKCIPSDSA